MKNKKGLKIFLIIFTASLTLCTIFNTSINLKENVLLLKNIEALAEIENNLDEAKKFCTEAGGLCFYKRILHTGIHIKED